MSEAFKSKPELIMRLPPNWMFLTDDEIEAWRRENDPAFVDAEEGLRRLGESWARAREEAVLKAFLED